jgi:hypothetical protein
MYFVVLWIMALAEYESTNGANGNTLTTILTKRPAHRLVSKGGHHPLEAAISKTNNPPAQFFLAYPNTFTAEYTFIRVINV